MLQCNVETTMANVSVMKTECFSCLHKHITYDQIGRMTLPLVQPDLNEAVLSLFEKLNLKI